MRPMAKKAAKKAAPKKPEKAAAPTMDAPGEPTLSAKEQQKKQRAEWEAQLKIEIEQCEHALTQANLNELAAKEAHKDAKSVLQTLVKDLRSLKNQLASPKGHLPLTSNKPLKGQKGLPDPGPLGPDEHGAKPIGHLSSKDIKRINPEAFELAAKRKEPIGLTDTMIEAIASKDIKTISDLEKFIATEAMWMHQLPGVGPKAVDRISDTIVAFRAIYPVPAAPEVVETAVGNVPQPAEWEKAAAELRGVIRTAKHLSVELAEADKDDGASFCNDVAEKANDVLQTITNTKVVTDNQRDAIKNWAHGVAQWQQPA